MPATQVIQGERQFDLVVRMNKRYRDNPEAIGRLLVTTPSGLQYRILEAGSGKSPGPTDTVTVNYRGTLVNGHEFDSSYDKGKPITFRLNGVIKGWTEGLQHVKEGGKIQLVIPPELAYGNRGPLAHQTLIFDVELISVGKPKAAATTPPAPTGKP